MAANGGSAIPEALKDARSRAGHHELNQPALSGVNLDRSYSTSRHAPAWPKIDHRNPRPQRTIRRQWSPGGTGMKLLLWLAIPVLLEQNSRPNEVPLPPRVQSS